MYNFSFMDKNCQVLDQSLEKNSTNSRSEANTIEVSNQEGVSVSCDFRFDLCTVTLAGWHHGEYHSHSCCQLFVLFSVSLSYHHLQCSPGACLALAFSHFIYPHPGNSPRHSQLLPNKAQYVSFQKEQQVFTSVSVGSMQRSRQK